MLETFWENLFIGSNLALVSSVFFSILAAIFWFISSVRTIKAKPEDIVYDYQSQDQIDSKGVNLTKTAASRALYSARDALCAGRAARFQIPIAIDSFKVFY